MSWRGWEDYEPPPAKSSSRDSAPRGSEHRGVEKSPPAGNPSTPAPTEPTSRLPSKKLDRGRRMGARWCYVTPDTRMVEYALAKAHNVIQKDWILFKSLKEAKRWIALRYEQEFGSIRNLRRQVDYPLFALRPDGLKEKICVLRIDFVYERPSLSTQREPAAAGRGAGPGGAGGAAGGSTWLEIIEDTKPRKGPNQLREDVYKLKKKWFESQYGRSITES